MDDDLKYLLKRIAAVFLVLLAIALGLRYAFRGDEARLSERVEEARAVVHTMLLSGLSGAVQGPDAARRVDRLVRRGSYRQQDGHRRA